MRTKAAFSQVPEPQAGKLAARFRPWLKFDSLEQWRPLSISQLFQERIGGQPAHEFCSRPPAETGCTPIQDESQFDQLTARAGALGPSTYINTADGSHGTRQGRRRSTLVRLDDDLAVEPEVIPPA